MVKNLPTMQETHIRSLGWEDALEKGTGTHSRILTWKITWTEEPDQLQSMGSRRVGHNLATEPPPNQHLVRIHCETWPQIHILSVTREFESLANLSCFGQDLALFPLPTICSPVVKTMDHTSSSWGSPSFPASLSNSFGIRLVHFSPCG